MRTYPVISERTWEETPHLRIFPVLPNESLAKADVVICTLKGEPRNPCAPDDHDVDTVCHRCGAGIVHRASAPDLPKECWRCFKEAARG